MNRVRIFRTWLDGATDISSFDCCADGTASSRPRKTLVLDLADVRGLSRRSRASRTSRAWGFGPPLPDGSRTILLVSDDNFSQRQRTTFLLFRLRER